MSGTETVSVLLVDDTPANLLALEAVLAGLGLDLVTAASGEEALRLAEEMPAGEGAPSVSVG